MNPTFCVASSCFLFLSLAAQAGAFPIPPQPLWDLITQSERIVFARVERIEEESEGGFAVLRVIETWKGPLSDRVRVDLQREVACPPPPRYIEGKEVLAFLQSPRRDSTGGVWETVGDSYGVLYLKVEERQDFFRLVQRIQSETSPMGPLFEKDWHVEAVMYVARPGGMGYTVWFCARMRFIASVLRGAGPTSSISFPRKTWRKSRVAFSRNRRAT